MSLPAKRNQLRVIIMHYDGHSMQVSIIFTGCSPVLHIVPERWAHVSAWLTVVSKIFPTWSNMCQRHTTHVTIYAAKAHPGSAKESESVTPKKIMNLHPDWRTFSTYSYISISITSSIHHHPRLDLHIGTVTPWPTEELLDSLCPSRAKVHHALTSHLYHGHINYVYHMYVWL